MHVGIWETKREKGRLCRSEGGAKLLHRRLHSCRSFACNRLRQDNVPTPSTHWCTRPLQLLHSNAFKRQAVPACPRTFHPLCHSRRLIGIHLRVNISTAALASLLQGCDAEPARGAARYRFISAELLSRSAHSGGAAAQRRRAVRGVDTMHVPTRTCMHAQATQTRPQLLHKWSLPPPIQLLCWLT